MQITEITHGLVTVCMPWTQLRRLLECARVHAGTEDTSDLELALEALLVLALISDDIRCTQAVATALEAAARE